MSCTGHCVWTARYKRLENVRSPQKRASEERPSKLPHLQPKMPRLDEINLSESPLIVDHSSERDTNEDSPINKRGDCQLYIHIYTCKVFILMCCIVVFTFKCYVFKGSVSDHLFDCLLKLKLRCKF